MRKVVFVIPNICDTHYLNRISEFKKRNIEVVVYGFKRGSENKQKESICDFNVLGIIDHEKYWKRVILYLRQFRKVGKIHDKDDAVFYLGGLDIAMFFHMVNPSLKFIYEECDLTYTYMKYVKKLFKWIDKSIIRKSLLTVFTSDGFVQYHFEGVKPHNVKIWENKLNREILEIKMAEKHTDEETITIGYVGIPRFDSVYNFIDVFCKNFPNRTFHVFGGPITPQFESLSKYPNCIFHGYFKNPSDLPKIYASIDLVIATYDAKYDNVKYAEPNKIYEAIYFETPIVASSNTFLADKIKKIGIGYEVDATNEDSIVEFVKNLTKDSLKEKIENTKKIDKKNTVGINESFFGEFFNVLNAIQ